MENKLKGMFKLSHRIALYIPTKNKENEDLNAELIGSMEDRVASVFSDVNGGATATDAIGYWKSGNTLIKEKVRMVFSYTENLEEAIDKALELAGYIKDIAHQDAVSVEVNRELYII